MRRALVVDDYKEVLNLTAILIEESGDYDEVDIAESGEEALELFEYGKYELVVLDLGLRAKTGVDTCIEMKEIDPNVIIVAMTGYSEIFDKANMAAGGFDGWFSKPLGYKDMIEYIKSIVNK